MNVPTQRLEEKEGDGGRRCTHATAPCSRKQRGHVMRCKETTMDNAAVLAQAVMLAAAEVAACERPKDPQTE